MYPPRVMKLMSIVGAFLILMCLVGCQASRDMDSDNNKSEEQLTPAKEVPTPFPTKVITFIVPTSPGGGFDTAARLLSPYLTKYLGKTVIIENVPGANWATGMSKVFGAEPDGHTIGIFNMAGNLFNQTLMDSPFDLNEISWVGRISVEPEIGAASLASGIKNFDDLKTQSKVITGIGGVFSINSMLNAGLFNELGIPMEYVNHDGSSEAILGAIRGDIDWITLNISGIKPYVIDSKELTPIILFGADERLAELPDVPTATELGLEELDIIGALERMVGTTPCTPEDILEILREAFLKAVNDPDFVKEYEEKAGIKPSGASGEEVTEIVKEMHNVVSSQKDIMQIYFQ